MYKHESGGGGGGGGIFKSNSQGEKDDKRISPNQKTIPLKSHLS